LSLDDVVEDAGGLDVEDVPDVEAVLLEPFVSAPDTGVPDAAALSAGVAAGGLSDSDAPLPFRA
jgi:hypothetical protein